MELAAGGRHEEMPSLERAFRPSALTVDVFLGGDVTSQRPEEFKHESPVPRLVSTGSRDLDFVRRPLVDEELLTARYKGGIVKTPDKGKISFL